MLSKIIIKYKLECLSGLRIGAGNISVDIGGIDSPVIKDPITKEPYIPGSSIKGKMRSLYEWLEHSEQLQKTGGKPIGDIKYSAAKVYGCANNKKELDNKTIYKTRAHFSNAYLSNKEYLEKYLGTGIMTEIKPENNINRLTSEANPRFFEQVPKGAEFEGEIIITIYNEEERSEILGAIKTSIKLLEDSYLGGGGTRGSGRIRFTEISAVERKKDYYTENAQEVDITPEIKG